MHLLCFCLIFFTADSLRRPSKNGVALRATLWVN
jgi:hypothetical protein